MVTDTKPSSGPEEPIQEVAPVQEPVEQPAVEAPVEPAEVAEPTLEEIRAEAEQLRQDLKAKEEESTQAFEKGRRKGQGDLDREVATAREAERTAIERRTIADQLEALYGQAQQGDTAANEKFLGAMADARYHDIWQARVRERSGQVDIGRVQADVIHTLQLQFREHPKFKELGEKKIGELEASSETQADFLFNAALALAERETEKRLTAEKPEIEKAVKAQVLEEERRKAGGVVELRGAGGGGELTPARYKAMPDDERAKLPPEQIDAMTRKYLT